MQLTFRYGFLKLQNVTLSLADWQYLLLVLSTVCIAAGGYIINNIFDFKTDSDNKPNDVVVGKYISETLAYNLYIGFTIIGVAIGLVAVLAFVLVPVPLIGVAIGMPEPVPVPVPEPVPEPVPKTFVLATFIFAFILLII